MGILNSNQVLAGARTAGGYKTYAQVFTKKAPEVRKSGSTITVEGGIFEVEGNLVSEDLSLNLNSIKDLLMDDTEYTLGLVPKYLEPMSKMDAVSNNVSYYVGMETSLMGNDSVAYQFINPDVEEALKAKGGYTKLSQKVYDGTATPGDITVFNSYEEELEKLRDPRYVISPLFPIGVELVLMQTVYLDNSSKANALWYKDEAGFKNTIARLGEVPAFRKVMTTSSANSMYLSGNKKYLVKSAMSYSSQADAMENENGNQIDMESITTSFGGSYVAIYEYNLPSHMPYGQTRKVDGLVEYISKKHSMLLGRIDPIYLARPTFHNYTPQEVAMSPLTHYADPEPVAKVAVSISGLGALTLDNLEVVNGQGFMNPLNPDVA